MRANNQNNQTYTTAAMHGGKNHVWIIINSNQSCTAQTLIAGGEIIQSIERLKPKYSTDDWMAISRFLSDNPNLYDALVEAPSEIEKIFGEVELSLNISRDPEIESMETLFIVIHSHHCGKEASDLKFKLVKDWLVHINDPKCKLAIDRVRKK